MTAYNACDRFLSRKYPNRRRLKNGLRYLLAHREGFAVWQNETGNYVGGFRRWQFGEIEKSNAKIESLRDDARAVLRDVKPEKSWSEQKNTYELLTAIFNWTNAPVEIDLLTSVCAVWWNITDETVAIDVTQIDDSGAEHVKIQIAESRPDVYTENEQRDYLSRLWNEILELPVRQRTAVLLNLKDENGRGVIDLWLVVGVFTEILCALSAVVKLVTVSSPAFFSVISSTVAALKESFFAVVLSPLEFVEVVF